MSNESFFDKVKDFVKGHPDQADSALDKAGDLLNERTGGKYADQITKGSDAVRGQLGIPTEGAAGTEQGTVPTPEPAPSPDPAPGSPVPAPGDPTPTPGTAPEPPATPQPAPDTVPEPAPGTTGEQPRP